MMSAKVGTGIVAELGAMRISEEIDALEVMGINSMTFLCATRLLAAWIVLPFMYISAIGVAYPRLLPRDRRSRSATSPPAATCCLLAVPEPAGPPLQPDQGHDDGHRDRARGLLLRLQRQSGGPVGVGTATAKSMVLNLVLVTLIGMLGTQVFWGANRARRSEASAGWRDG